MNIEDFLQIKGICSDTTIGIEGDYLLTDLLEEYLYINTSDIKQTKAMKEELTLKERSKE